MSSFPSARGSLASLVARDVTKSFGPHVVLERVSLTVGPRSRIGVVAPNGTGKSTLLRILAGVERPDSGRVTRTPPGATVGYLPQEPDRADGETVRVSRPPHRSRGGRTCPPRREPRAGRRGSRRRRRLRRRARGVPRARRARPRRPNRGGARRPRPAVRHPRRRHVGPVGWAGGACEPRRDDPRTVRRVPPRRADQRSRFRRTRPTRTFCARRSWRRSGDRVARPRFLDRTVDSVLELDEHAHTARVYAGGMGRVPCGAGNRAPSRRGGLLDVRRERDLFARPAREQRQWSVQGTAKAAASGEPDKHIRQFKRNSSEHVAAKAKITDKALERLEVNAVDKPWESWDLRMEIAAAPRSGAVVAQLCAAVVTRERSRSDRSTSRSTSENGSRCSARTAAEKRRCSTRRSAACR